MRERAAWHDLCSRVLFLCEERERGKWGGARARQEHRGCVPRVEVLCVGLGEMDALTHPKLLQISPREVRHTHAHGLSLLRPLGLAQDVQALQVL